MWHIESSARDENTLLVNESLFTLANGYLGVRGTFEEGYKENFKSIRGTYINAFYDITDINYGESAYGFPKTQQKLLNVIDAGGLEVYLDDERVTVFSDQVTYFKRLLHLDKGYSERIIKYKTKLGKQATITFKRLVSFDSKELFAINVDIQYQGNVKIISTVSADVTNFVDSHDPRVNHGEHQFLNVTHFKHKNDTSIITCKTKRSNLLVTCTSHDVYNKECESTVETTKDHIIKTYEFSGDVTFNKYNIYTDSRRHKDTIENGLSILNQVKTKSFDDLLHSQHLYMSTFWKYGDIVIEGDDALQQGLRFNLYQLLQSVGKDECSNIAAKGLTGEGYEGHYFWDTEIYIFPVFLMINPTIAKNLLMYRYSILEEARGRAKELGHSKGALFPWRTIAGTECSAYFPAGTAQYHINADIAYSFIKYFVTTNDLEFIEHYGLEVLVETARVYLDMGFFDKGSFKLNAVTGPDEYTAIVNNNYYTNAMAKYNMKWAVRIYRLLENHNSRYLGALKDRLSLTTEEITAIEEAANHMYLPIDEELNINPQDDTFLSKEIWNFKETPDAHYPLLLHYHPLTIYRYQVCKQADTVLAHFLLEDEQPLDVIKDSYEYYEQVTTHDSSLSSCVFSIMASKIGDMDKAYNYFIETSRLDLDNTHKNTKDGLHMANMGGTWMSIVYGFAGLRLKFDGVHLAPKIPKQLNGYSFYVNYKNSVLRVTVNHEQLEIVLEEGTDVAITLYGEEINVSLQQKYIKTIERDD
ncbi:glycoside hydrolase family 65 protein [Haloplasma contractile]|uniref:Trehalose phosphorylase protein n=1 Tax=Haloplasma contractile SSD-17B TaxID=1033810 RepID=F7PVB5_9MOLU|nr:glycosyl hydrolase family 65 protein [Haloplasma contractile]ERJ12920.1 Trehalose phosphorylase protein [Haloplasma contractile SSD-17B]